MKKTYKILIGVIALLLLILILFFHFYNRKTFFTTDYNNGNLAGNLYNGGFFCEKDGIVYFSNPNDEMKLYCFDRTGTNLKRLSNDHVAFINADDHYLYYTRNNSDEKTAFSFLNIQKYSLCRTNLNGSDKKFLDNDPSLYACQVGDYIYYIHYDTTDASTLYRVKIDGSNREQITKDGAIAVASSGQYLYYAGVTNDHNLYRIDSVSGQKTTVSEGFFYNPIVIDQMVYFMDASDNYHIAKLNLSTGQKTTIVNERTDCFNVYGNYIYYQAADSNHKALCRIKTDGSDYEEVYNGNFSNINITSSYVYFTAFNDTNTFYRTPTIGNINVSIFHPGKDD